MKQVHGIYVSKSSAPKRWNLVCTTLNKKFTRINTYEAVFTFGCLALALKKKGGLR